MPQRRWHSEDIQVCSEWDSLKICQTTFPPLLKNLPQVPSPSRNRPKSSAIKPVTSPITGKLTHPVSHTGHLVAFLNSRHIPAQGPLHWLFPGPETHDWDICISAFSFPSFLFQSPLLSRIFQITELKTTDGPIHYSCPSNLFSHSFLRHLQTFHVAVVQSLSHGRLFVTTWTAARQGSLSSTVSWSLLKFMSIDSVMLSNHLILCHPLLLPSIFSRIRVFSNESYLCIRWSKHWSFSFSISPSNEYPGLIAFRIDWFDLLAVRGTLKSFL